MFASVNDCCDVDARGPYASTLIGFGRTPMTGEFDRAQVRPAISDAGRTGAAVGSCQGPQDIPVLVSDLYHHAPDALRVKLLEHLLRPVGPLAMVAIAAGAFARFAYRLRRDAMPIPLEHAARITSAHVLHLARYVEQSSPEVLRQVASLVTHRPLGLAAISASALLVALSLRQRSDRDWHPH
jgi:hypothetical protein